MTREFLELVGNGRGASLSLFSDSISGIFSSLLGFCA